MRRGQAQTGFVPQRRASGRPRGHSITSVAGVPWDVSSLREPPGNDMISPFIWAAHDAVLSAATRSFNSHGGLAHSHADRLDLAAADFETAEAVSTADVNRLRETLG